MNKRCHAPIRKAPKLSGYWQHLTAGTALDSINDLGLILPSQWFTPAAPNGEKALLIAVLADALNAIHRRKRQQIEEIEFWLSETDQDSTAPISFPRICRLLSLSPGAVRRQLLAAIAHAQELGLVERRTHHRPWPKERAQAAIPCPRSRIRMVSHNGKRMSYRRLTDAILQGVM